MVLAEDNERMLSDFCRWNSYELVSKLLKKRQKSCDLIDVLTEEGICFRFAIRNNNVRILTSLINYYFEFKEDNEDLRVILEDAIYRIGENRITPEIMEPIQNILKMK
jgi:hypothetical protein